MQLKIALPTEEVPELDSGISKRRWFKSSVSGFRKDIDEWIIICHVLDVLIRNKYTPLEYYQYVIIICACVENSH